MDALGNWQASFGDGIDAELSLVIVQAKPQTVRKTTRIPVDLEAGFRQRGAPGVSVRILDLSIYGFRASTHLTLYEGTDVWLRLPGLEAVHAKVAWTEGHYVGCAFERPLHPAVLDMIVDRASGNA